MTWSRWIRTVEVEPAVDTGGNVIVGQIEALLRTGAKLVHVDVADGLDHSVAQLSVLTPLVHRYEGIVDMHLTGGDPLLLFGAAAAAGADSVTFDATAVADVAAAIQAARDTGLQVGVAIGPGSDPDAVAQQAQQADIFLCVDQVDDLVALIRRLRLALPSTVAIQVEGPSLEVAGALPQLYEAGASVFAIGEAIFSREDLPRAYRRLVQEFA